MNETILIGGAVMILVYLLAGIRIVRPTHKIIIETLGKYQTTREAGFSFVFAGIQTTRCINITETMVDIQPQTVITKDNLNAVVDAVVYYKISDVKKSIYNVDDHSVQLSSLARTTLRAVIGKMTFTEANEERDRINQQVEIILDKETDSYGVDVLRVEIQKIEAPGSVQEAMNEVVKAERIKLASKDKAEAVKIEASGEKEATIQRAEGQKKSTVLKAEGDSKSIELVAKANAERIKLENEALRKYFKDEAVTHKQLEVTQKSLSKGSKYIVDTDKPINLVLSEMSGVTPVKTK